MNNSSDLTCLKQQC